MQKKNYVLIEFNGNETSFNYDVERAEYLFTALMGIEATLVKETGLDIADIRMLVDEERPHKEAKAQAKLFDPNEVVVEEDDGQVD